MRSRLHIAARPVPVLRRFLCDEAGATLVELTFVVPVFLLLFLGMLDFGRLGYQYVLSQKAMEIAARIATVRNPACAGVPTRNQRGTVATGTVPPRYGTACSDGSSPCADPGTISCDGDISNATVAEIWGVIVPLLPGDAEPSNLKFQYRFDSDLGFLGGPYVPVVTVELQNLNFQFSQPISALAKLAGGAGGIPGAFPFPPMSISLPGEDLALGNSG